jgi:hypothetical protein
MYVASSQNWIQAQTEIQVEASFDETILVGVKTNKVVGH